jgi:hypothetical protein
MDRPPEDQASWELPGDPKPQLAFVREDVSAKHLIPQNDVAEPQLPHPIPVPPRSVFSRWIQHHVIYSYSGLIAACFLIVGGMFLISTSQSAADPTATVGLEWRKLNAAGPPGFLAIVLGVVLLVVSRPNRKIPGDI